MVDKIWAWTSLYMNIMYRHVWIFQYTLVGHGGSEGSECTDGSWWTSKDCLFWGIPTPMIVSLIPSLLP